MPGHIITIARYTLLEALRTRLPALALLTLVALTAASFFVREIAIIENERFQLGFYAAAARITAAFLTALYVITSISREFNDKGLDMVLALDLRRSDYVLGKLGGFLVLGALLAALLCLPLLLLAPGTASAQWGLSLVFELAIVAALALFCVISFSQLMAAATFVLAFYLLGRSLTAVQLMVDSPITGADAWSHQFMSGLVNLIALLLPALDRWTQTAWLVNEAGTWSDFSGLAVQTLVYVVLLSAATMFDFHRRSF